ncbi:MAG: 2-iminoacetate synthase ThiH [Candidatus Goldbacteria bacterium]|nr:2-iminoacetate synthase ThiH [Candidatus Goldiibacteriota bacterium]
MIKEIIKNEIKFFNNWQSNKKNDIYGIIEKEEISKYDFLNILFNSDKNILELIAKKAKLLTDSYFGKMILLYAPLYISNFCINKCVYCGFSSLNKNIVRKKMEIKEIEKEMIALKQSGFDTILILTGDDRKNSPVEYIGEAINIAKKYFSEILIEVYALTYDEYKYLVSKGLTGVTIYQETYDEKLYNRLHLAGPKKDFYFRLHAPERAIAAGVKEINIGCLLGLNKNFLLDVFLTAIHADYLQRNYTDVEISISYPRIQPAESAIKIKTQVNDFDFTRIIMATRIFLPRVGLNLSTREKSYMRDNLIGLGITKMSAGSKTTVGGYASTTEDTGQFEINDRRKVEEIIRIIASRGYRPEFTNWVRI